MCAASTSPSPRDARTRTSSNSPTSTFSAPSAQLESQHAAKTPSLLIAVLTRALMDSHYGKAKNYRSRVPRTSSGQPANLIAHTDQMTDNSRVRRSAPVAYEKSRLSGRGSDPTSGQASRPTYRVWAGTGRWAAASRALLLTQSSPAATATSGVRAVLTPSHSSIPAC